MGRPTGVSIIAIVAALNGIIATLAGGSNLLNMNFPVLGELQQNTSGWAMRSVGLGWLVLAGAFWSGQGWSRSLGLIWSGISLLAAAWVLVTHLDVFTTIIVPVVVSVIVPAIVFWYLREERVKEFFART
jgi:Flp pilus assembly protein TadB